MIAFLGAVFHFVTISNFVNVANFTEHELERNLFGGWEGGETSQQPYSFLHVATEFVRTVVTRDHHL